MLKLLYIPYSLVLVCIIALISLVLLVAAIIELVKVVREKRKYDAEVQEMLHENAMYDRLYNREDIRQANQDPESR